MLKIKLLVMGLALTGISSALAAETCQAPEILNLPQNGAVITYEQLNFAAKQVSAYAKANMAYKTCLDQIITRPGDYSRAQWRAALEAYNQSVPAEQAVWSSYENISSDWIKANKAKPK